MGYYEWNVCPYCGKRISDVRIGAASDTTIGPGVMKCPHCGGVFRTKKSEWAEKTPASKMGYSIRVVWWSIGAAIFGATLGFLGVMIVMGMIFKAQDNLIIPLGLIVGIAVGIYAVTRVINKSLMEVEESLKREPPVRESHSSRRVVQPPKSFLFVGGVANAVRQKDSTTRLFNQYEKHILMVEYGRRFNHYPPINYPYSEERSQTETRQALEALKSGLPVLIWEQQFRANLERQKAGVITPSLDQLPVPTWRALSSEEREDLEKLLEE